MRKNFVLSMSLILSSLCVSCSNSNSTSDNSGSSSVSSSSDTYSEIERVEPVLDDFIIEDYASTSSSFSESQPTFSSAKWIWDSSSSIRNTWVRFRKSFNLSSKPSSVTAKISASSKYFAYVNGELVVYEGSLKRGANTSDGYYDLVDLTSYLVEGENTICILVWYWGSKEKPQSYSNVNCSQAGLIFESQIGINMIVSDTSWKVSRDYSYNSDLSSTETEYQPNYRLPEYNISYNANNLSDSNWISSSFNDSSWSNAVVLGNYGESPWNYLWKRTIPLTKDYGVTEYKNSADYVDYTTISKETIVMKVGVNVQLSPVFTISSPANKVIRIYTEATNDVQGNSVSCFYTTKEGEQSFECLGFMNGQFVMYEIPEGVTIKSLGYRMTGYDTEKVGSFDSDSTFYSRIWQMSYDTLYVTMRDNFMDCPNRERAQWMGDVTNEMEQIIYSMDSNSYLLYEKALRQMVGFATTEGVLPTVAPINSSWFELPIQNLCTIAGAWTYYMYTGRKGIIEEVYSSFLKYIKLWKINASFLVSHRAGSWDWMDNDTGESVVDETGIENSWYCRALSALSNMALLLDDEDGYEYCTERYNVIKEGFTTNHLEDMIKSNDDRANSIAVLAGLVDEKDYSRVTEILRTRTYSSPFWEKYVYDALCEMGEIDIALSRMKTRYWSMVTKKMYNEYYSTLWEKWNETGGTKNHAWSGGPMTTLSKYVLGVQPLTSNYGTVLVKPSVDTLANANGVIPTLKGNISVSYENSNNVLSLSVSTPSEMNTILAIPFDISSDLVINNRLVCTCGNMLDSSGYGYVGLDDNYIYLLVDGGNYQISVE